MLLKIQRGGQLPSGKYKNNMTSLKSSAPISAEFFSVCA